MKQLIFFCVLAWDVLNIAYTQTYCSICSDHTMCRFGEELGRACEKSSDGGVTKSEIEEIVKLHNDYRAKVANGKEIQGVSGPQPSAANMRALVWDENLAQVAQRWADQCTFQHDKCREDPRFSVGQNIYWSSGKSRAEWSRAIQIWYDEVSQLNPESVARYNYSYNTGHYAQLAWAKTQYIGCGRRTYGVSYRLHGLKPLEYVLSDGPKQNVTSDDADYIDDIDDAEPGYFGEKVDLSAGVEGAITSKDLSRNLNVTENLARATPRQDAPGFFGGAQFHPNGAQGAVTRPGGKKPAKPIGGTGQVVNRPNRPYWPIPNLPTATRDTNFDSTNRNSVQESTNLDDELDSSEESSMDNNKNVDSTSIFSGSIQIRTYLNNAWDTQTYDMGRDHILVCNYGPSGNFIGEKMYEVGSPCFKCPPETTCRDGLCV